MADRRTKAPARRPRRATEPPPSLATSAYLQTVLAGAVPPVEPVPAAVVEEAAVFPPLPEAHIPRTAAEFLTRIAELWEDAQQRFLRIGELLTLAETRLDPEERARLLEALNRRIGKSARSQLMSAYRAIRDNRVPREMAAAGYGTVYLLSRMTEEERAQAAERGLLRPDVRQSEIRHFWTDLRAPPPAPAAGRSATARRRAELEARRARLVLEIRRIDAELARLID